ncbi:putative nuclease HARBI1 [Dermacentor albipictus]|uniref:putative nuclease HARBI1 n=1 Tax=Dermacentor albipictus TaxID=60249 RepID=UPI0031FE3B33
MAVPFIVQWLELQEERQFCEHRDAFQMPEEMFRSRYRLSKDLARWLCEELRPVLVQERVNTRTALTVEVQVLCALRFLATGAFQGAIASDEDCRFQGCVGAVDGTFVCIRALSERDDANKAAYFCRKGYYALNVVVVCDANLRITALETSYPGSVHDSFVWKASSLYAERRSGSLLHGGEYLLGDSAYPLQPWLVTPVPGSHISGSPAAIINAAHSSLRSLVERSIGVLKMRFRCLQRHRALYRGPVFTSKITEACAVLHNLCVRAELPEPDCTSGIDDFDGDVNAYDDSEDVTVATLYRCRDTYAARNVSTLLRHWLKLGACMGSL